MKGMVFTMTKKMTKKEMFALIGAVVEKNGTAEMVNFINHEIELLEKKSAKSGQTKVQKENEVLKAEILELFKGLPKPVTISEFCEQVNSEIAKLSNQKLSALFNQLVKAGKLVKTVEKKKSYFSIQ